MNFKNPEARDDDEWLDRCDRLGVDPAVAMERSLEPVGGDVLPAWAE